MMRALLMGVLGLTLVTGCGDGKPPGKFKSWKMGASERIEYASETYEPAAAESAETPPDKKDEQPKAEKKLTAIPPPATAKVEPTRTKEPAPAAETEKPKTSEDEADAEPAEAATTEEDATEAAPEPAQPDAEPAEATDVAKIEQPTATEAPKTETAAAEEAPKTETPAAEETAETEEKVAEPPAKAEAAPKEAKSAAQVEKAPVAEAPKSEISPQLLAKGKKIFGIHCIACHQLNGQGLAGAFPPLVGSEWVLGPPERPIAIVLNGLMGEIEVKGQKWNSVMAPLGAVLKDDQIAAVLTYVRNAWGNSASEVDVKTVKKVRKAAKGKSMWNGGAAVNAFVKKL